jgi:hypothetical protein
VTVHPDAPQAASFPEEEALDPRPADALPQATAAWDASACVHPDATVDAPRREVRPPSADGAERLVAQAQAAQVQDDSSRQWELQAAPAAALAATEPCTRVAVQSVERSCAAPEVAEQSDEPQSEPLAECSLKPQAALPQMEPVPQEAVMQDVQAVR